MDTFVGRDPELSAVRGVWERSLDAGGAGAAIVVGEPGSGKTRLLAEARHVLAAEVELHICGFETEQAVPLAAAAAMLRTLSPDGEAGWTEGWSADGRGASLGPLPLFEATYKAMAGLRPVLLVVDDLQWVDGLSMALCHYLLRAAAAASFPVCLLGAGRPVAGVEGFATSVRQLLEPQRSTAIELSPLSIAVGARFAHEANPTLSEAEAIEVARNAAGSPFWLEILARSQDGDADVEQLLGRRLRGVAADSVALLAVLAVAARPLLVEEAAEIESWPSGRARDAAIDLVRRGVVSDGVDGLRVAHDLLRSAAVRRLPPAPLRRAHQRVAEWLGEQADDDPRLLLEAINHCRASGIDALALAGVLAASPGRSIIGEPGLSLLSAIVDAAPLTAEATSTLHQNVAALAAELGRHSNALTRWRAIADRSTDDAGRARALCAAAEAAFFCQDAQQARALVDRCRHLQLDLLATAELDCIEAGVLRWLEHQPDEARHLTNRSLNTVRTMAKQSGGVEQMDSASRRVYLRALTSAGDAARIDGDSGSGRSIAEEQMTVAARGFSDDQFISGASAAGLALLPTDVREAEHRLREAWAEANHHCLVSSAIEAGWWFVRALHLRGALAEAEEVARECIDLGHRIGEPSRTLTEIEAFISVLETSTGDWTSATERLRQLAAAERGLHYRVGLLFQLATVLARYDDGPLRDEIHERLVTARAGAEEVACSRCLSDVLLRGTEAWARVGEVSTAAAWLADYEQLTEVGSRPWRHQRAVVSVCVARRETDASVAGLEGLHREAMAKGIELEALWAMLDLGGVLAGHDPDRAKAVFEAAASDADRLGATNERRLAEQRLRRLGARAWRRGRVGEPLSDRELEIAAMVASGRSNPEIAQSLLVSRKTVERHVSNILAKVGARNRADLARRMAEDNLGSS